MLKKMKIFDFQIMKLLVFLFTLMLLTAWPGFRNLALSIYWYWYLIFIIILIIPLYKRLFSK